MSRTRTIRTKCAGVVVVALTICASAGCGEGSNAAAGDRVSAIEQLTARSNGALRMRVYDTIDELLPNVTYRTPTGEEGPLTAGVVVGTIVEVAHGKAFVDGERGSTQVAYDDPDTDWRTLHMTLDVDETLGGPTRDRVVVGLSMGTGSDPDKIGRGLKDLGRVLIFLGRPTAVFDYDPSVFAMVDGGGLLATIDQAGEIHLPVQSPESEAVLLGKIRTLDDLRAAGTAPIRVIQVDTVGERVG